MKSAVLIMLWICTVLLVTLCFAGEKEDIQKELSLRYRLRTGIQAEYEVNERDIQNLENKLRQIVIEETRKKPGEEKRDIDKK